MYILCIPGLLFESGFATHHYVHTGSVYLEIWKAKTTVGANNGHKLAIATDLTHTQKSTPYVSQEV